MPVGTLGTVKGVTTSQLAETGAQMVLSNTYHLHLQPGEEIVADAGGLHRFMGWDGPMLTDSGGFQVFSLGDLNRIDDEGVDFRNPRNGSRILLTPERSMQIQMRLGADVAMAFDQCPPYPATENDVAEACRRTHAWLGRCADAHQRDDQALFGIVQGGCFPHLRDLSARTVADFNLPGIAIGGVSVGEPVEEMHQIVRQVTPLLPADRPRYLMGIGTLREMAVAVANGIDMFDCVMPTRNARNGMLFTAHGTINIRNKKWTDDFSPIDEMAITWVDTEYSKAYLRHLFSVNELLGKQIATIHNLGFYMWLVREARKRILAGDFLSWKTMMVAQMDKRL
jgi:queuine tRNA-ribosyltransferase